MSKFNLSKAVEKAKFVVQKRNLPDVKAQVLMNIDVSGSAQGLFKSGQIQEAFQRVLPVGILFDDNGEVDVFTFQSGDAICHIEPTATEKNYEGYIETNILKNKKVSLWGGTDYANVIRENLRSMGFLKQKSVEEDVVVEKGGWFSKAKTRSVKSFKLSFKVLMAKRILAAVWFVVLIRSSFILRGFWGHRLTRQQRFLEDLRG
jgi:hypothetical protein